MLHPPDLTHGGGGYDKVDSEPTHDAFPNYPMITLEASHLCMPPELAKAEDRLLYYIHIQALFTCQTKERSVCAQRQR